MFSGNQNNQHRQNNVTHTQSALFQGIGSIILSLPWAIASFAVFATVADDGTCTGTPYSWGDSSRWAYLTALIIEVILFPIRLTVAKKRDNGEESSIAGLISCMTFIESTLLFGFYIYACIALGNRGSCANQNLVNLLWATVLIPVIVMVIACCCCCCCMCLFGAVLGAAGSAQSQQQAQGQTSTEANQLRHDLEEGRNLLEEQIKETENAHKIDMA